MDIKHVVGVYFSHSDSAKRIATAVSSVISENVIGLDICEEGTFPPSAFEKGTAAVFAMPASGGRLSALAAKRLLKLSVSGIPAVAVILCPKKDFGDSLLELSDVLTSRGFCVIGAAAFVADGKCRPDDGDFSKLVEFASACAVKLEDYCGSCCKLDLPGSRPYKERSRNPKILTKAVKRAFGKSEQKSLVDRAEPKWFI